eukprot:UN30764
MSVHRPKKASLLLPMNNAYAKHRHLTSTGQLYGNGRFRGGSSAGYHQGNMNAPRRSTVSYDTSALMKKHGGLRDFNKKQRIKSRNFKSNLQSVHQLVHTRSNYMIAERSNYEVDGFRKFQSDTGVGGVLDYRKHKSSDLRGSSMSSAFYRTYSNVTEEQARIILQIKPSNRKKKDIEMLTGYFVEHFGYFSEQAKAFATYGTYRDAPQGANVFCPR